MGEGCGEGHRGNVVVHLGLGFDPRRAGWCGASEHDLQSSRWAASTMALSPVAVSEFLPSSKNLMLDRRDHPRSFAFTRLHVSRTNPRGKGLRDSGHHMASESDLPQ